MDAIFQLPEIEFIVLSHSALRTISGSSAPIANLDSTASTLQQRHQDDIMNRQARKLVTVGDGAVGKTSLYIVLTRGVFPSAYVPTVFESYVLEVDMKGEPIEVALWDTAAHEDRLRPLIYPDANAFLVCFSIDSPVSLVNVIEKWDPEIKHFEAGRVPRFLVGCKKDLRHDPETLGWLAQVSQLLVATEQGMEMARVISAEYFECSSKTGEGVRELFARVMDSMEAGKVVRFGYKSSHRLWHHNAGCIVV